MFQRLPELIDDPGRVLSLIDQLRQRTRNGNDLFFLEQTAVAAGEKWPDSRRGVEQLLGRFFDHVPAPPEELFRWIDTPRDGRVELWREIPAGRFLMGSLAEEKGDDDERPRHEVESWRRSYRCRSRTRPLDP